MVATLPPAGSTSSSSELLRAPKDHMTGKTLSDELKQAAHLDGLSAPKPGSQMGLQEQQFVAASGAWFNATGSSFHKALHSSNLSKGSTKHYKQFAWLTLTQQANMGPNNCEHKVQLATEPHAAKLQKPLN